ncbi:hypothetical protein Val02_62850 [Virgisporangium aliadipatigenens]|uniref:Uncharacterized protein n=1 Tax=Virgisporangium aliadipatigenens TaxID=741659 RepID=A0A8J3YPK1_9ACTN|nr:hypothetical protein [Virgisporangium aliadipatigenens]GIJ49399.1 hypothetical protein Val02_62850 [Virgisporangium aliadipatigenens]
MPVSVWRTSRTGTDGTGISASLAQRIVVTYSFHAATVIDLTNSDAITTACLRGRRRHHRAYFDGAADLVITNATRPDSPDDADPAGGAHEPVDVAQWFGTDLAGNPRVLREHVTVGDVHRQASLVVATLPLRPDMRTTDRVRLELLVSVCGSLLRNDGCLVLILDHPEGTDPLTNGPPQQDADIFAMALRHLQRIIVIDTESDTDQYTYGIDEELLAIDADNRQWRLQLRAPRDLHVFVTRKDRPSNHGLSPQLVFTYTDIAGRHRDPDPYIGRHGDPDYQGRHHTSSNPTKPHPDSIRHGRTPGPIDGEH